MKRSAHNGQSSADKFVNAVLFPFGYYRVRLGDWPDANLDQVFAVIRESGGKPDGEGGMPTASSDYYFRIDKRRVTLTVLDYGPIYLLGPKKLVRDLAVQIAA